MKLIPLTQGVFAQVDDEDFEYLNQFNWFALKTKYTFYASRNIQIKGMWTTIRMHRVLMNTPRNQKVDHKDHYGLNNQKYNLRRCTDQQNQGNRRKTKKATSPLKGVSWHLFSQKWRAQIRINKIKIHLGLYTTEIEAALAYNEAAKKEFGEFACLNFSQ